MGGRIPRTRLCQDYGEKDRTALMELVLFFIL
ncbi:hypothetical protein AsAng_0012150 [Aureispira anguillae]|uniref:Uncharacterized protein n=1 Tax=Aureispira anguillae TaxID=2864201 RepID=A0A915YCE9_9BACT|nr:hypothetical protein AsAng_0012150 [Aureispira anguillae]